MKTSWNETKHIEAHLMGTALPDDALQFDVQLLLNDELADNVVAQQKAYEIIQQYGRKQLRKEIEAAHQKLFTDSKYIGFSGKIMRLFRKP